MMIRIPGLNFYDKILQRLGKKREVMIPSERYEKFGPDSHLIAKKKNFFRALFRSTDRPLPKGMINIYVFLSEINHALMDEKNGWNRAGKS